MTTIEEISMLSTEELCARANAEPGNAVLTEVMLKRVQDLKAKRAQMESTCAPSLLSQLQEKVTRAVNVYWSYYDWFVKDVVSTLRTEGSIKVFLLPLMCVSFAETSMESKVMMAMGVIFVMYLGMKLVKSVESTEWRKKLREDATRSTEAGKKPKEKVEARRQTDSDIGSTKKKTK
mmetsp:Transcript_70000/g.138794  ORF Transcript_70000/g.138794 Transcript_70000/m.138794 type:complete len:177 (-) Transcript_70000:298-828(-)|eukprot:CAMPEP_0174737092 /NCGR_PEP_ID=MMETSP1094-20130205/67777_1 /TAXON_ID=156173 /ORGANISM="Chrysochromulina brevifilum, Strain UTEX LB 985" /LENGTH=176 /DNA_ID=CAMNT_0015940273 /DNA_START=82 /DNA_END=612 /DNA_ORIENTATION=+